MFSTCNHRACRLLLVIVEGVEQGQKEVVEGESLRVVAWAIGVPGSVHQYWARSGGGMILRSLAVEIFLDQRAVDVRYIWQVNILIVLHDESSFNRDLSVSEELHLVTIAEVRNNSYKPGNWIDTRFSFCLQHLVPDKRQNGSSM